MTGKDTLAETREAAQAEFVEQRPMVDLLQKAYLEGVRGLKDGAQHLFG